MVDKKFMLHNILTSLEKNDRVFGKCVMLWGKFFPELLDKGG
jgi:hypothetical protein